MYNEPFHSPISFEIHVNKPQDSSYPLKWAPATKSTCFGYMSVGRSTPAFSMGDMRD